MKRYYFDYAAATPLDAEARAAMRAAEAEFANPASLHAEGRAAKEALESARRTLAMILGAKSNEIVFTSGATESDNMAILGSLTAAGEPGARVLTLPTEHAAVRACTQVARASGYDVIELPVDETGLVSLESIRSQMTDATVLISIAMATSEIGTLQPIGEIGRFVREVRIDREQRGVAAPLIFHTDASSALGLLPLAVDRLGVDLMTLSSVKSYGPQGVGALYVRAGTPLTPLMIGGGQERSLRAGTPSASLAAGFAAAAQKAEKLRAEWVRQCGVWQQVFLDALGQVPGMRSNGHAKKRLANIVNLSFARHDGEDLVLKLDAAGFAVATGAACAESNDEPSHVLLGIGRSRAEAQSSLRISFGRDTSEASIRALADAIRKVVVQ